MGHCRGVAERDTGGYDMSKFGDDMIRSLKEAVAHAKGEGPGTKHSLGEARDAGNTAHEEGHLKSTTSARRSKRVAPRKSV